LFKYFSRNFSASGVIILGAAVFFDFAIF
jgi:hypothetical protein